MPPRRPEIKPWLRPIGRRAGEVQFGVLPEGVIVSGVTPAEVQLLARLDGSMSRNTSFEAAAAAGVPKARWRALLDLVGELGVLASEPGVTPGASGSSGAGWADGLAGRPSPKASHAPGADPPHVLVEGLGTMSEAIAALLRNCGARVTQGRPAVDLVVADLHADLHLDPPRLAIVVGAEAIDPRRGDLWLSHATPAVPVLISGPWGSIGPVVEASPRSPCLWCLDLHRTDRDREWPTLMAQLLPDDRPVIAAPDLDPDPAPALAQLVAGTVALLAERVLTGHRPPPGVSVEVSLPWPRMDHRRWTRHPLCRRHPVDRAVVA